MNCFSLELPIDMHDYICSISYEDKDSCCVESFEEEGRLGVNNIKNMSTENINSLIAITKLKVNMKIKRLDNEIAYSNVYFLESNPWDTLDIHFKQQLLIDNARENLNELELLIKEVKQRDLELKKQKKLSTYRELEADIAVVSFSFILGSMIFLQGLLPETPYTYSALSTVTYVYAYFNTYMYV